MPFFKKESRPIIRRLTIANLRALQERDPSLTYEELRKRYETMAIKVVRKRRANHVQSWRPDKNGRYKPLIYGGTPPPIPPHLKRIAVNNAEPKQVKAVNANKLQPAAVDANKPQPAVGSNKPQPVVDANKPQSAVDANKPPKSADAAGVEFLVASNNGSAKETEEQKRFVCCKCKKELAPRFCYPIDRWGSDDIVWCAKHWKVEQNKLVCAHIKDVKARGKKMRELAKLVGDDDAELKQNDGAPPTKRRKKVNQVKKCKWCGLTNHSRRSSLKCPYNKKNAETYRKKHAKAQVEESQRNGEESGAEEDDCWADIQESDVFNPLSDTEEENEPEVPAADATPDVTPTATQTQTDATPTTTETQPNVTPQTDVTPTATQTQTNSTPTTTETQPDVTPQTDTTRTVSPLAVVNPPMQWNRHDVVYAQFEKKWFLAHITATLPNNHYDVYFLGDGETAEGLTSAEIRPHGLVNRPLRRPEMLNKEFYCDGDGADFPPGRWKVRQIVGNKYKCVRISGDDRPNGTNVEQFDIGYVHRAYDEVQQHLREQSPMWFARYERLANRNTGNARRRTRRNSRRWWHHMQTLVFFSLFCLE